MTEKPRGPLAAILTIAAILTAVLGIVVIGIAQRGPVSGPPAVSPPGVTLPSPAQTVATINGIAIPARELQIFIDKDRAETLDHFQTTFHATADANFWTTPYGGTTPTEHLINRALKDISTSTVQLQWAVKYGLIPSASYDSFLTGLEQENKRRAKAIAEKTPIYGPTQYTEANYFHYLNDQYSFDLQAKMRADGTIAVDQPQLDDFLATHPDVAARAKTPAGETRKDATEHVVQLYVENQYEALLAHAAETATIVRTVALTNLEKGGCAQTGECVASR
ncbi:hypothetical protein QFZ40_002185 [Arthrobacter pascens]|uniref:hypothetical protein n=1 Tax=Arthrobacter pascens TaxID=1677 RepID=UPI002781FB40|nr:hypothetical protein [Arthrobacter pascens]MDQ0634276.1 hypothetical protein [Arthrobacter pascens]